MYLESGCSKAFEEGRSEGIQTKYSKVRVKKEIMLSVHVHAAFVWHVHSAMATVIHR